MNYKQLFTNNVLYITGVGRSGTTIIGQIIASMRPVYYLFEPSILRPPISTDHETLRRNLFEDYFLHEIHGRCNPNVNDWSFWGNHMTLQELVDKHSQIRNRQDALKKIEDEKPLFVIKNPEAQHQMNELADIFPGIRFIHILRNGLDVIGSSVSRGWFVDDYDPIDDYKYPDGFDWIPMGDRWGWHNFNPTTRAACTWRVLTEMGMEYIKDSLTKSQNYEFKYEFFCDAPYNRIDAFESMYDIKLTDLTEKHLQSVKDFKSKKYDIKINDIQQPERDKFVGLMEKMGYL